MDVSEALEYVRGNCRAVIATHRSDGTPQMSPVGLAVINDQAVMNTRETAYKVKQLRADPRAYLCVFPDKFVGRWVQLNYAAEVVSLPRWTSSSSSTGR